MHPQSLRVHYLNSGSAGRGWGELDLRHPHAYVDNGTWRAFARGARDCAKPSVSALVVFGYSSPYSIGALLTARALGTSVYTQSDSSVTQHLARPAWLRMVKRAFLRTVFPRETRVWAIGGANSKYWSTFGLTNQANVSFESPVVPQLTRPTHHQRPAGYPCDVAESVVLYVGRLSPEKRPMDAVRAVGAARRRGARLRLIVAGAGDARFLHDSSGALPEWVEYLGPVEHGDLGELYSTADVLVVPSEREAYGLVVREALQFGLPVVATTAVTAARELCDMGWNLVPVGDSENLATALVQAASGGHWVPRPPRDVTEFYERELFSTRTAEGGSDDV